MQNKSNKGQFIQETSQQPVHLSEQLFIPQIIPTHHNLQGQDYQPFVQKMHNILIALYMVTDLVEKEHAVKDTLRDTATSALSRIYDIQYSSESLHDEILRDVVAQLSEVTTYFDVLFRIGYISPMNYDVVLNEIQKLQEKINESILIIEQRPSVSYSKQSHVSLDSLFNMEDTQGTVSLDTQKREEPTMMNTLHEQRFISEQTNHLQETPARSPHADTLPETVFVKKTSMEDLIHRIKTKKTLLPKQTKITPKPQKKPNRTPVLNKAKEDRKKVILTILKQKKNASINDICIQFKDCSTKTIQRDINELIDENKVVKQGSRRWSTYQLA